MNPGQSGGSSRQQPSRTETAAATAAAFTAG